MLQIASVLIKEDGKYLLVQEGRHDVRGLWNLPGGRVLEGESLREAAKREAKEETGLDVEIGEEIFTDTNKKENAQIHVFQAKIKSGKITWDEKDLLNVMWTNSEDVTKLKFRLSSLKKLF